MGQAAKSARTIVISGVPDGVLNDDVMSDILVIHFQKAKNNGGDVEEVKYPTREKGVAYITFEDQEVVESVLQKNEHRLEDRRLPRYYPLKVTPYCENVFSSVTAVLDMSVFKDKFVLEDLIQELKKKSTALSFGSLQSNGHISVQGSFPTIKWLRDFLLLKAKSLSEDKNEASKSHQRPKKRLSKHRLTGEMNNFVHDAEGEKQVVVLDTDIYHYMKCFFAKELLANTNVVISDITDGDVTTLHLQKGRNRPDTGQVLRVKEKIENQSIKLHNSLRKERIDFEKCTRDKKKYRLVCESVKSHYPDVLVIPYDTHIDVIGSSSAVFKFTQEVNKKIQSLFQNRSASFLLHSLGMLHMRMKQPIPPQIPNKVKVQTKKQMIFVSLVSFKMEEMKLLPSRQRHILPFICCILAKCTLFCCYGAYGVKRRIFEDFSLA